MDRIVGRDQELALVRAFAGGLRDGPRALLLEGEAGIGKTAVWRAALAEAEAAGCRVLRCVADTLLGGDGDDSVDGNIGADVARLGTGADRFQWDPGDGSDTVEGQGGADALDFNASNAPETIDVSRNGARVRLFRNVGAITMDFNDIESLVLRALGGIDAITIGDLTGTDLKTADVDLGATGGGGDAQADTVVVNGRERGDRVDVTRSGAQVLVAGLPALTRISGSEGLNDTLRLNTLGGNDRVTIDPDAELLITPVIDLGTGE